MSEENDFPETIPIEHYKTSNFSSHYASGAFFGGPTADGMYHLTFYSDIRRLRREIGTKIEGSDPVSYNVSMDEHGVENVREDKVTVTIAAETAEKISNLIVSILDEAQKNNAPS